MDQFNKDAQLEDILNRINQGNVQPGNFPPIPGAELYQNTAGQNYNDYDNMLPYGEDSYTDFGVEETQYSEYEEYQYDDNYSYDEANPFDMTQNGQYVDSENDQNYYNSGYQPEETYQNQNTVQFGNLNINTTRSGRYNTQSFGVAEYTEYTGAVANPINQTPQYENKNPATHQIFTQQINLQPLKAGEIPPGQLPRVETGMFERIDLSVDRDILDQSKKTLLDVDGKAGKEDFKDFFSDTVIAGKRQEKKSQFLSGIAGKLKKSPTKNKKTKKGKKGAPLNENDDIFVSPTGEFVQVNLEQEDLFGATNSQEKTKPLVFEDEQIAQDVPEFEFTDEAQTETVIAMLVSKNTKNVLKFVTSLIIFTILLVLNLTVEFSLNFVPDIVNDGVIFYTLNAGLLLGALLLNYSIILPGFLKLLTFRADLSSIVIYSFIFSFIQPVLYIFLSEDTTKILTAPVSALVICCYNFGQFLNSLRILNNMRFIADGGEKYASAPLYNTQLTERITRGVEVDSSSVLIKRKTSFTDDFLFHSNSYDADNESVYKVGTIVLIVNLICGVITYVLTSNVVDVVATIALSSAFAAPCIGGVVSFAPFFKMHKDIKQHEAMVPGFSAIEDVVEAGCVVVEGHDLYEKGQIKLHGIKTFEKERIDMAILYAASVLIQSCDTMSGVFLNVIQNKTEILFEVDSVVYEDGLGYSFWVGKERVILGNRELLGTHEIQVPSRDYENRYTNKSTRDAIYLSVSGKLSAMFILSYSPSPEVAGVVHGLEKEGVSLLVRTRDFNITPDKISRNYNIPRAMVSVIREVDLYDLSRFTEYAPHTTSSITFTGKLVNYFKGIKGCYNVRNAVRITNITELASMLVGITVALVMTIWGAVFSMGILSALLFQTAWLALVLGYSFIRKY